jgi:hypothetical protein
MLRTFENLWYVVHVLFMRETFEMPISLIMTVINVECLTQSDYGPQRVHNEVLVN